jgi:molybdate transport system ATP-binding protein
MKENQHFGIVLTNNVDKNLFVQNILSQNASDAFSFLNQKKGILYSDLAIEKIIATEYQYDILIVAKNTGRKLQSFSSGEKKKAYLEYCISQNLDYLVLDNPLDHLDTQSRISILALLEKVSQTTIIIQIADRQSDILHFINKKFQIKDTTFEILALEKNGVALENNSQITIPNTDTIIAFDDEILIEFKSVSVQYEDKKVLNTISWTIKKGEFWQLIGPNGSGKSTLLSLINGDNTKGYGQDLYLFGIKKGSGESVWDIKKKIGYFNPAMTDLFNRSQNLEQMILSGFYDSIGLYCQPTHLQIKIVQQWIAIIELTHLSKKPFSRLTIGQKRLALIVRAIIKKPLLLILDEPIEGLDDGSVILVTHLINKLMSETEITVIYVSHRFESRIKPTAVFELIPSKTGSAGKIKEVELN